MNSAALDSLRDAIPLLAERDPVQIQPGFLLRDLSHHKVFFGTGLCTPKEISSGLPFEYLSFPATAEVVCRSLNLGGIVQVIADTHAKHNQLPNVDPESVDLLALTMKRQIVTIVRNLGLEGRYKVLLASEFHSTPEYLEILSEIPPQEGRPDYVRRECADMEYLARMENVCLKISWKVSTREKQQHKTDEVAFDKEFVKHFSTQIQVVYIRPAVTFDSRRPTAAPYVATSAMTRVMLTAEENVTTKMERLRDNEPRQVKRAEAYLESTLHFVIKTFHLHDLVDALTLEEKIQQLIFALLK